jgi:hypothetical protein
MRSEPLGPQQGVGQVKQQARGDETGEGIIEDHDPLPLKPFAGIGVADRRREKAEAEDQHEDVQHGMLLCVARGIAFPPPGRGATRRIDFRDGSNANVIGIP